MMELKNDEIDLWLSKYFDGELTADEKAAVEAKLQADADWRTEWERVQRSTKHVEKILGRYHQDDGFSGKVVGKLNKPAKSHKPVALSHRLRSIRRHRAAGSWAPMALAAGVALALCGGVVYLAMNSDRPTAPVALTTSDVLKVTDELQTITWSDGTRIFARKGAEITRVDDRTLKLSGQALFFIAPDARPFTVQTNSKLQAQALGTRFEVTTTLDSAQIRVAEGHVRVGNANKTVDALGGTMVLSNLDARAFDPRDVSRDWRVSEETVAPWSQVGGSAGHSFLTPLRGPKDVSLERSKFIPFPAKVETPDCGVVISARNRAYMVAKVDGAAQLLELALDGSAGWKNCGVNGALQLAPVITPRGYVVCGALDGTISAYDPVKGTTAWSVRETSMLGGLTADPNGQVLVSTQGGLVALDGKNGKQLWRASNVQDLMAPATVLASGLICAPADNQGLAVYERGGKHIRTINWPRNMTRPAAVAAVQNSNDDEVWVTSNDGYVARVALQSGPRAEKYFGWQLKCAPIGTGLLGQGSLVMHFEHPAAITAPAEDTIVGLVQDSSREVFAGYRKGILHLRSESPSMEMTLMRGVGFTNVKAGEVLRNGLAVVSGKLVVTTTQGVQIFE